MSTDNNKSVDWPAIVFSEKGMNTINQLASKRFSSSTLAEEAGTYVIDVLSENDWQKLKSFKSKASPYTFLYTLVNNSLEEFSRKRFGRPRPPTWLSRQGELWVRVWKQLCLERQPVTQVADRFSQGNIRDVSVVHSIIKTIKTRIPSCGLSVSEPTTVEDIAGLSDSHGECSGYLNEISYDQERQVKHTLILMIRSIYCNNHEAVSEKSIEASFGNLRFSYEQLESFRAEIQLTDQEKVLLKMIYQDGLSKSATALGLGLTPHQLRQSLESVFTRIRRRLQEHDIQLEEMLEDI